MNQENVTTGSPTFRLSMMMFLQYAVWGLWLPQLGTYLHTPIAEKGLGFSWEQIGAILGLAGSIGAVVGPFLAGQIADRFINAERWLGVLLILGGVTKYFTAGMTEYQPFLWMSVLYSIFYMPTLALTNSVAFAHLKDPQKGFAPIRTWGTIGWIVAATVFPLVWLQTDVKFVPYPFFFEGTTHVDATERIADAMRLSGMVACGYGMWCILFLPKTPPTRGARDSTAFVRAFRLFKDPGFMAAALAALLISMIHQVYFIVTSTYLEQAVGFAKQYTSPIMAIGQISEIFFLAILPLFMKRLGFKGVLLIGALAFAVRYAIFAFGAPELKEVIGGAMVLHGICYAFFFAGAYVYVDKVAPVDIKHSAQTVFAIVILGVGPALSVFYNSWLADYAKGADGTTNWQKLWLVQAGIGLVAAAIVGAFFRDSTKGARPHA